MKKFEGLDYYALDELYTEEELSVRDTVRRFVSDAVLPRIADDFQKGHFPVELTSELAALGLFGATIQGYDCAGVSPTSYGLMMQELERGDSGLRSFVSVQGALCMYPIYRYAAENLKQKYLPEMAAGRLIGCFGLTEPDYGSNPAGMKTVARKDGSDYVLNGTKMWITNGSLSGVSIVWARVPDEENKMTGFIVESDLSGIEFNDIENKFSLRASVTSELVLKDVRVPGTHRLGVTGLKGPFSCLNQARYGISWGVLGAAMACYDEALNYAKTRIQFDVPIASFQLVQAKLVYMLTEITKGQLLAHRLGRLMDQDKALPQQISMAKMNNVSKALEIARLARDVLGANGITYEYQCARHLLNLETVNTYEGTEDIHRLILGQDITGIPAFK